MNITYILIALQFIILVAIVVILYKENKRLEKEFEKLNKED